MLTIYFRELETARLRLRRLTTEDLPLYHALASSAPVTEHMLWQPHTSMEESAASIQKALRRLEAGESCRWVIADKRSDILIGIIDLIPRDRNQGICSFAYMLMPQHWNQGLGTEALKAVVGFAFREWGASEIRADHFVENGASGAVMRKSGMQPVGIHAGKYEKNGVPCDAQVYSLSKENWIALQPR